MKSFKICLSKISFNIILEIKRYKKLVKRYRTNLISLGNRKLRLPVSILSRNAENRILKYSYISVFKNLILEFCLGKNRF